MRRWLVAGLIGLAGVASLLAGGCSSARSEPEGVKARRGFAAEAQPVAVQDRDLGGGAAGEKLEPAPAK